MEIFRKDIHTQIIEKAKEFGASLAFIGYRPEAVFTTDINATSRWYWMKRLMKKKDRKGGTNREN